MKKVDSAFLNDLRAQAQASDRKRAHRNLHPNMDDPVHRFCMAAEPGTIFPIHRHPGKWELLLVLQGKVTLEIYGEDGSLKDSFVMEAAGDNCAAELDETEFHRLIVLERVVLLEVKQGPYEPPLNAPWDTPVR